MRRLPVPERSPAKEKRQAEYDALKARCDAELDALTESKANAPEPISCPEGKRLVKPRDGDRAYCVKAALADAPEPISCPEGKRLVKPKDGDRAYCVKAAADIPEPTSCPEGKKLIKSKTRRAYCRTCKYGTDSAGDCKPKPQPQSVATPKPKPKPSKPQPKPKPQPEPKPKPTPKPISNPQPGQDPLTGECLFGKTGNKCNPPPYFPKPGEVCTAGTNPDGSCKPIPKEPPKTDADCEWGASGGYCKPEPQPPLGKLCTTVRSYTRLGRNWQGNRVTQNVRSHQRCASPSWSFFKLPIPKPLKPSIPPLPKSPFKGLSVEALTKLLSDYDGISSRFNKWSEFLSDIYRQKILELVGNNPNHPALFRNRKGLMQYLVDNGINPRELLSSQDKAIAQQLLDDAFSHQASVQKKFLEHATDLGIKVDPFGFTDTNTLRKIIDGNTINGVMTKPLEFTDNQWSYFLEHLGGDLKRRKPPPKLWEVVKKVGKRLDNYTDDLAAHTQKVSAQAAKYADDAASAAKFAKAAKYANAAFTVAGTALDVYQGLKEGESVTRAVLGAVASTGGSIFGTALAGAALGSVVPGAGTVTGFAVGLIGGIAGGFVTGYAADRFSDFAGF